MPSCSVFGMTSNVAFVSEPLTGMMPLDGMSSSAGAGNPVAIDPEGWNPFTAVPA